MINRIKDIILKEEYDFLRTNGHLAGKIIFLTLGGSYAYGTNVSGSDLDVRGCALNSKSDLLGMTAFEQVVERSTDTTIYSFNKLIGLLLECNPNTIEMLGCRPEHYFFITPIGKELIDNRRMFLSKKAVYSFGGYANQQLRRLENALARDHYPQAEKERHILGSCMSAMMDFGRRYSDFAEGSIRLSLGKSDREELETEIFADVNLQHYPLRDYQNIWAELGNIVKDYGKLNKRNNKKDDAHLNKHAQHLIRLYLMCLDILEKEEIITYREKEHDLLMSIRCGEYQKSDGTYRQEFFEMVDEFGKKLEYAKEHTALPENPDYKRAEEFLISVNERVVRGEY